MKQLIKCGSTDINHAYFNWHINTTCNFKCSYCPSLNVSVGEEGINNSYKMVLARLNNIKIAFDICITGGEPSFHPNIIDILTGLNNNPLAEDITFFTNLSRPISHYKKIIDLKLSKVIIFASYHPEYHSDFFIDKCIKLNNIAGSNLMVQISLYDDPEYWDNIKYTIESLRANNIICRPCLLKSNRHYDSNDTNEFYQLVTPYLDSTEYEGFFNLINCEFNDGTIEVLKNYEIKARALNNFKNFKCTPMSFNIEVDGTITNTCTKRKIPLHISNENLIKQEICPHEYCSLDTGMDYYKEKT
jgi:hypothetical protein